MSPTATLKLPSCEVQTIIGKQFTGNDIPASSEVFFGGRPTQESFIRSSADKGSSGSVRSPLDATIVYRLLFYVYCLLFTVYYLHSTVYCFLVSHFIPSRVDKREREQAHRAVSEALFRLIYCLPPFQAHPVYIFVSSINSSETNVFECWRGASLLSSNQFVL